MIGILRCLLPGLLLLGCSSQTEARNLYCEGRLVSVGDPVWQVARACPEPFWREDYETLQVRDRWGSLVHFERVEVWTLNFGQRRLMRRLVFSNGTLRRIETLGYGVAWQPGSRRCSTRELENAGQTAAEIFARCGQPDHRIDLSPPAYHGYAGPYVRHERLERWTYEFGSNRHARELEFFNGRLQGVQTLRR
jgi:hypothetical protein